MAALTTAEKNRRKRERKKKERAEEAEDQKRKLLHETSKDDNNNETIEIEYVPEPLLLPIIPIAASGSSNNAENKNNDIFESVRIVQERSTAVIITDDDEQELQPAKKTKKKGNDDNEEEDNDDESSTDEDDVDEVVMSKRKFREAIRPTISQLKQRVQRPDLVEAHDVTANEPEFLLFLKSIPGTVPVPRHWGRKRKYLQGKRGYEKQHAYQLPDFILKTGITELRDTIQKEEEEMSIRQKNRSRVAPKMGSIDVDYGTLHAAFFKHQTKPKDLTKFGDLYYEGKEIEMKKNNTSMKPGGPLSKGLQDALGITSTNIPPPWLINMQRYGPPPSWGTSIPIPGLNAPLPTIECQYGFHPGGWGKPPIDPYGRPLYGGNPFDPPGSKYNSTGSNNDANNQGNATSFVTSDGKTITKSNWGELPTHLTVDDEEEQEEDEESNDDNDDDMEGSSDEDDNKQEREEGEEGLDDGTESMVVPPPPPSGINLSSGTLRKDATDGDETPFSMVPPPPPLPVLPPKQLYQIIEQRTVVPAAAANDKAIFASNVSYVVPGSSATTDGAESVLSKVLPTPNPSTSKTKKRNKDDDDDDDEEDTVGKNFKF